MIPIAKPFLTEAEAQSAYETILSGWVMQGPKVAEFEEKFKQYTGAHYAVAVSNGTTALHLAVIAAGVREGDEVICPSYSFIATANCIKYVDAVPVFADIDPGTFNINPAKLGELITEKTKAIIIAHQFGLPCDIDALNKIANENNLKLIEDAACAAGSSYKGRKIGSDSELCCFSFHPRKVISTGEGGMVVTNNENFYKRIKHLRQHSLVKEDHPELGYNYRMTDIQASIGIKQLEKLDWIVSERRKIAKKYVEELKDIDYIILPAEPEGCLTNYQSFNILLKENAPISRDELIRRLERDGISSRPGIANAHLQSLYRNENANLHLPESERASEYSIMIPLFVPMKEEDILHIIFTLRKLLR